MKVKLFAKALNQKWPKGWFWSSQRTPQILDLGDIEDEINRWISENPTVEIVSVHQSATGGSYGGIPPYIMVMVVYDEKAS